MTQATRFVLPSRSILQQLAAGQHSNAIYNYYGWGPISAAKRRRVRFALSLGSSVDARRVIDMGTADGMLLPSLSRQYEKVAAIDIHPEWLRRAGGLVREMNLGNVTLHCNRDRSAESLRAEIGGGYELMFLLETLEHVGTQPDMWGSKIAFLRDCFDLLEPNGRIVISVPKMVGPVLFAKNLVQRCCGLHYDPLTWRQLLASSFWYQTDELEPIWNGGHVGFNHRKLDRHLTEAFTIQRRKQSLMSVFYLLGR